MGCCASRLDEEERSPTGGKPFKRAGLAWTADQPITQGELLIQRDTFWDTSPSYGGREEIWQALKAAVECQELQLAQSILDAANVILPTGNLADGCFDELGNRYEIPVYCIVDPTNLISDDIDDTSSIQDNRSFTPIMVASTSTSVPAQTSSLRRNSSSTSASATKLMPVSAPPSQSILSEMHADHPILVRLSTGKDIELCISTKDETVATLKRRIFMHPEIHIIPETHNIRLIYLGRLLKDDLSIICENTEASQASLENTFKNEQGIVLARNGLIQALIAPAM
ncbi:Ubiquitin domain-containing protein 1 [Apophysomyces sp. BC1034]|nr:Ubiquitin domain-containing protein 1 [Apophysomyces sp. BC1015]KAG0168810.1 Ubiquitin domain-containing protein 1 [Apophysomyces sp. BC1021]KAG0184209.1 Ubiquitin domain-containing protein 1 [Apophysomyces sp. BC1034]